MKPRRSRKRYTPNEIQYIERWYPQKGAHWVATRLHRTPRAIAEKAKDLFLVFGETTTRAYNVHEVATAAGCTWQVAYNLAERAGALRKTNGENVAPRIRRVTIDKTWADTFIRVTRERQRGEELAQAGWMTRKEVARYFGMCLSTLEQERKEHRGYGAHLTSVRTAEGKKGRQLFQPRDIEAVRVRVNNERATRECAA